MFWTVTLSLLKGLGTAARLFGLTLLFSLPLGLLIAFGTMSKWCPFAFLKNTENPSRFAKKLADFRPVSAILNILVWIIRGTPLMLQLFVVLYGPGILFDIPMSNRFLAAEIAFVINYACYFSEIYRGGIESIPKGQYEAGAVLGMTRTQVFFKVVLLQVVKRITPAMGNEVITLTKDTSLARVIGVTEIIMSAERFTKQGLIWPLFSTGLYFLVMNGILTVLLSRIEKKMDYFKA
jgi:polar amino acid transport system permease protein